MITRVALAVIVYLTQESPGADVVDNECNAVIEYHTPGPDGHGGMATEVTVHPTEACPGMTLPICLQDASVIAEGSVLTVLGCSPDMRMLVVEPPSEAVRVWREKLAVSLRKIGGVK